MIQITLLALSKDTFIPFHMCVKFDDEIHQNNVESDIRNLYSLVRTAHDVILFKIVL